MFNTLKRDLELDTPESNVRWAEPLTESFANKDRIYTMDQDLLDQQKQLEEWRNSFTIQLAKQIQRTKGNSKYSMAVFCSGGCLDTLAGIRAGFKAVWSTEINSRQAKMFEDLTRGKCLGDAFGSAVSRADRVTYIKSGQPCPDYTSSASKLGAQGETGWMFVKQVDILTELEPWAICLENTNNATSINDGDEVNAVVNALEEAYVVYVRSIQVWRQGDPSNRTRLFIIALHKDLGQAAHEFTWPADVYNEATAPIARLIAVPDAEVPEKYWRYDKIKERYVWQNQGFHKIQVISRKGVGMGHSDNPHSIQSWEGLLNGPTTLGGGGRRVELDWNSGQPISRTRMATPVEYCRAASQCDDYLKWCASYNTKDTDKFILLCLNNGVPMRTSVAVDLEVMKVLTKAEH